MIANCDVAYVIGANDVTNPVAKRIPKPYLRHANPDVEKAKSVLFVKRSLSQDMPEWTMIYFIEKIL